MGADNLKLVRLYGKNRSKRMKYECEKNTNDISVSTPNRFVYILMTNDYI